MNIKSLRRILRNINNRVRNIIRRAKEKPAIAFIFRILDKLGRDGVGDMAASIAYYALLSLFPLLLGIIALLGIFLPSESVQSRIFDFFNQYIPNSSQFIQSNITSIIKLRGTLGILSLLGLFSLV